MESCPHCYFLMRDDAVECGVCHQPRVIVAREGIAVIDDVRVGAEQRADTPLTLVFLLLVAVGLGLAAVAFL